MKFRKSNCTLILFLDFVIKMILIDLESLFTNKDLNNYKKCLLFYINEAKKF